MVALAAPWSQQEAFLNWKRSGMQNDLDLTRKILEDIRARTDLWPRRVEVAGYDSLVVARHVERLHEDGLVEGARSRPVSDQVSVVMVRDLTTAGHEFLSALESGDVWARLKSALNPTELGALSFKGLASIAKDLAERAIRQKLGLE